jgi:hypothetical protein
VTPNLDRLRQHLKPSSIIIAALSVALLAQQVSSLSSQMPFSPTKVPSSTALSSDRPVDYLHANIPTYPADEAKRWGGRPQPSEKEYWEAKGALIWLPMINRVVEEGISAGVVQPSERALFQSLMLGVIGVEAGGANPFIKRPHPHPGAVSSDGLTQLIRLHLWSNENPFDPLTSLRAGVRTLARYYRGYGNRWDLSLVEHLSAGVADSARVAEAEAMKPDSYPRRVVEINKMARRLLAAGDVWDDHLYFTRDLDEVSKQGMALAPVWSIFDPPDLPFDWQPPTTSRAFTLWAGMSADGEYLKRAAEIGVRVRAGHRDDPGDAQPEPSQGDSAVMFDKIDAPTFVPRQPTDEELAGAASKTPKPAVEGVDYPVGTIGQPRSKS